MPLTSPRRLLLVLLGCVGALTVPAPAFATLTPQEARACLLTAESMPPGLFIPPGTHARGQHVFAGRSQALPIQFNGGQPCKDASSDPADGRTVTVEWDIKVGRKWRLATKVATLVRHSADGWSKLKPFKTPVLAWAYSYLKGHRHVSLRVAEKVQAQFQGIRGHRDTDYPGDTFYADPELVNGTA